MESLSISIDLTKLENAVVKPLKGKSGMIDCVIIPIEQNNIFVSNKGSAYLDLVANKMSSVKYGQTHIIKRSLPKDVYKSMTKEERIAMPVVGSLKPIFIASNNSDAPQSNDTGSKSNDFSTNSDDLPF